MKTQSAAVKKLNTDLALLKKDQASEASALKTIATQKQSILDQFQSNPTSANLAKLMSQMFDLGERDASTHDKFDSKIANDKTTGRKDLPKAESDLSLKTDNADRKLLGMKQLTKKPAPAYGEPWKPGAGQLSGSDTSHFQSEATFESAIKGTQFAAIKATEGTGYTDPTFKKRWAELGQKVDSGKMAMRMAYCFLDKGNGAGQAKHFLDTLGIKGKLKPGTRLALDWEGSALQSPQTLHDAANYIHKVTGLWPTVYTSASNVSAAKKAVPNAPMWDAQWTNGKSNHSVPFVQYSDGPGYDHDVFNGSLASLKKFAGF